MSFPIILGLDISERENHFFPARALPETELPLVSRLARETWAPGSRLSRKGNPLVAIFYVFTGQGEYRSSQGRFPMRPGFVFGFGPGDEHSLLVGSSGLQLGILSLEPIRGTQLLRENLDQTAVAFQTTDSLEIEDELLRMVAIAREGNAFSRERVEALVPAWLLTLRKARQSLSQPGMRGTEIFQKCQSHLREHFREITSVHSTATACGVSYSHMTRVFRENAGLSPHQYLLRVKMLHAAQRISTETVTLDELAGELGFADAFVFSKSFKRILGVSPREYRKALASS